MFLIPAGLILVFFYINIELIDMTLDVLPDVVGYVLIAAGLWKLRARSYYFSRAFWLSIALGVYYTVVRVFSPAGLLGLFISAAEYAGIIWLLKLLVDGVDDLEEILKAPVGWRALERWRVMVSGAYLAVFVMAVGQVFIQGLGVFGLVVATGWFVFCLIFVFAFFRAAVMYRKVMTDRAPKKKKKPARKYMAAPLPDRHD